MSAASRHKRHGVARVISKLGMASRSVATRWVLEGRVQVNGRVVRDAEFPVRQGVDRIEIGGRTLEAAARQVLMLNKPRGSGDHGKRRARTRDACIGVSPGPIFRGSHRWAGWIRQVRGCCCSATIRPGPRASPIRSPGPIRPITCRSISCPDAALLKRLQVGVVLEGERLCAKSVRCLRTGAKHAWLEIVLSEGRNRHIRRLLEHFGVSVLRLVRIRIGALSLGDLPKEHWRRLTEQEIAALLM